MRLSTWRTWSGTLIFAIVIVGLPALVRVGRPKAPFDATPLQQLRQVRPSVVIIGDSMAGSRIDTDYLNRLQPSETFFLLQRGGAASAVWYLYLKNYVAASGVRPKLVVVMFRDYYFHRPSFRTDGQYVKLIENASIRDEPVLNRVLHANRNPAERAAAVVHSLYPASTRRDTTVRHVHSLCAMLVSPRGDSDGVLRKAEFLLTNAGFRPDVAGEARNVSTGPEPRFDPSPSAGFLPHMMAIARHSKLTLCFYRVKRRPGDPRRTTTPALRTYLRDFERYVRSHGCYFVDETSDTQITADMYADGDHLSPQARQRYAPIFLRHIRHIIR